MNLPAVTETIVSFIRSIGIEVVLVPLGDDTFLPGMSIENGALLIDQEKLCYPGDLLHEAGHIAVVPMQERTVLNSDVIGKRPNHAAEEMMAMAWSYAAACHLKIDPSIVFHDEGYKGGGSNLLKCFQTTQSPIGVPMLQYHKMTCDAKNAIAANMAPYPAMLHWTLA